MGRDESADPTATKGVHDELSVLRLQPEFTFSEPPSIIAEYCPSPTGLSRPAAEVRGSPEFSKLYRGLKPGSREKHLLDTALDTLKSNMTAGIKIQKPLWPNYYVKKYGVNNLWKLDLSREARLIYTVLNETGRWIVVALEAFRTHKEYEKRFGYC